MIIQNERLQRLSLIIAVWFVAGILALSIFLMIYNNQSSDLKVEHKPAIAETTCKVTINGKTASLMSDKVNEIYAHDEIEVVCPDSKKIDIIHIGANQKFGEDQWITLTTQVESIKMYGKDMGKVGDLPHIAIHGTSGELDIYMFEVAQ